MVMMNAWTMTRRMMTEAAMTLNPEVKCGGMIGPGPPRHWNPPRLHARTAIPPVPAGQDMPVQKAKIRENNGIRGENRA